jgi:hypothetical protein
MLPPRPKRVEALDDYLLLIEFDNGERKTYDMKKNLEFKFYEKLKNKELFKKVKPDGINIVWETGEDIDPDELYSGSVEVND